MSTADNMLEMSFNDRRSSDRSWFNAVRDAGAALVQAAARATTEAAMETPMTSAEAGSAFAAPIDDVKAARHQKAQATLHRAKQRSLMVQDRELTVICPRHNGDSEMLVTLSVGHDGWALEAVPSGCSVEQHAMTPDERATLADRIDAAYGNWTSNQSERGAE